ncbi:hypothetical protein JW926_06970 [Candidatus Sumerlaeota bacterium]|nr:hypothetical protein [Candidatus Sumerlaeota bacterium]
MKIMSRKYIRNLSMMVTLVFLLSGISGVYGAGLPQIVMPQALQAEDVIGYCRVKSITNVLNVVDYWIAQVSPQTPPGTAKMSAGEFFGDPTLASVDASRPLTFLLLNPKKFPNPLLLFLPAKDAAKMQSAVQEKGSFALVKDNTLIIGDDQNATAKGAELWNMVKPFSESPLDTDILLFVDVEKTMLFYGDDLKQKIKNFQNQMNMMQNMSQQQQPGMAEQQKQLEAQLDEMIKTINDIKSLSLKGDMKKEGLLTSLLVQAKPQTELAKLFVNTEAISPSLFKFMPEGALKMAATGNPDALSDFNSRFANRVLIKSGATNQGQNAEYKKFQELQKQVIDNEMAISFFLSGKTGVNGVVAYKIKDPKLAMDYIRQTKQQLLMANNPAQALTVNVDYKENARAVDGINIHSYKMTFSSTNPMTMQSIMMFLPGGALDMEMAIVDKCLVTGMGTPVDQAIKAIKLGTGTTTLAAMTTFPQGGQVYGDINIIPMVNAILSPMFAMMSMMGGGQNPMDTLSKISAPPVTFFSTMHDGMMMGKLDFQLETIRKIAEGINSIKQQMMAPPTQQ